MTSFLEIIDRTFRYFSDKERTIRGANKLDLLLLQVSHLVVLCKRITQSGGIPIVLVVIVGIAALLATSHRYAKSLYVCKYHFAEYNARMDSTVHPQTRPPATFQCELESYDQSPTIVAPVAVAQWDKQELPQQDSDKQIPATTNGNKMKHSHLLIQNWHKYAQEYISLFVFLNPLSDSDIHDADTKAVFTMVSVPECDRIQFRLLFAEVSKVANLLVRVLTQYHTLFQDDRMTKVIIELVRTKSARLSDAPFDIYAGCRPSKAERLSCRSPTALYFHNRRSEVGGRHSRLGEG